MGRHLLNLTFGESLALVKEFPCFNDLIELDVLLVGSLHLFVHDLIVYHLLTIGRFEFCRGKVLDLL
jgi:hypothetical protein